MDKKELILEVASKLFSENGFDKTPVSVICKEAKISQGLVFHHFENKNGLLRTIFENTTNQVVTMIKGLNRSQTPIERLNHLVDMAFDSMANDKSEFRLYLNIMFQPSTRTILDDLIKKRFELLLEFHKQFLFDELSEEEKSLYSYLFISELDGIGMNYIYADDQYPILGIKKEFRNRYSSYLNQ